VDLLIAFVGVVLLTLGRRLFWLFVGCVGFALGFVYAEGLWNVQSQVISLAIGILMGLAGAVLALFVQRVAVALSGFAAGGFVTVVLLDLLGFGGTRLPWLVYVIGGMIGAVSLLLIFDWALIFLSSLLGAVLIVHAVHLSPQIVRWLLIALAMVGILFQARLLRGGSSSGANA
jgi:hypothetical protein